MTGYWQGFHNQDFEAIVDLGSVRELNSISIGALQDIKSWIWYPKRVEFLISDDNVTYKVLSIVDNDFPDNKYGCFIKDFTFKCVNSNSARYIKIKATNYGKCPSWHLGKGGDTWLFFDEVTVN